MNILSEETIQKKKNYFEIEERVTKLLKNQENINYYNNNLRRIVSSQFNQQYQENKLATEIAIRFFGSLKVNKINNSNNNNMSTQEGNSAADNSNILKIAEILKEVILSKTNKNDELEFIERPKKYDGFREPHAIES
jgi:hypothetical protein